MAKKIVSTFIVLLTLGLFCAAAVTNTAEIKITGENRYKAVRLTPEIYNAANADLSDLLVKDAKGENVPYFINSNIGTYKATEKSYPMELINSYVKDDSFYFDYKLSTIGSADAIATSIEFFTKSNNFAKPVDLFGSYDDIHWEFVQSDKLYSVDDRSKLVIEFQKLQKYTHYRIKLKNNLEKISFDAVNLIYNTELREEKYYIETIAPKFSVESKAKETNIMLEGLKNLKLCDVTIETDSMFMRTVSAGGRERKELYNLSFDGVSYADTTLPLGWRVVQDSFVINIFDGDDKPIDITGVTVRYYVDEVIFEAEPGDVHYLEFGADPKKTAPVYDIARYKDEILKGEIDNLEIGEISYSQETVPKERDYRWIFNVVIIAIALLLGAVIFLKLKQR